MTARAVLAILLLLAFAAPTLAAPTQATPEEGPDAPAATAPIATVVALDHSVYSYTGGFRGSLIDVPVGWNRVVLQFDHTPLGDPWDRTFAASVGGVEVLRGTTPRTPMTVEKDITRYAALLPQGGQALVEGYTDTFVAASEVTVTLKFYDDPTALAVEAPANGVAGIARFGGLCTGSSFTRSVTFPDAAPASATVEFFTSGHGDEEFWYQNEIADRIVHMRIDGVEIANAKMLPYTYAFLGFADNPDGTADGTDVTLHQLMWWTAQQGLDKAGVHANGGEIPPFRATVDAASAALLHGTHNVTLSMDRIPGAQKCVWTTSADVLLR